MISGVGSRPSFSAQNIQQSQPSCCGAEASAGADKGCGPGSCGDKSAKDSFDKGGCCGKGPVDLKGGQDEALSPEKLMQMLMELMQKNPDIAQQLGGGNSGGASQEVASV